LREGLVGGSRVEGERERVNDLMVEHDAVEGAVDTVVDVVCGWREEKGRRGRLVRKEE